MAKKRQTDEGTNGQKAEKTKRPKKPLAPQIYKPLNSQTPTSEAWQFSGSLAMVAQLLLQPKNTQTMQNLLEDIMTPGEIEELAERIRLFRLLLAGKTQREAAAELGISITTVSRGSRVVQYGTGTVGKVLSSKF